MRHVRMLGLCLVALLVMSAMAAGSAMAKKSPYSPATWEQFKYCPYNTPEIEEIEEKDHGNIICYAGITSGGTKGGSFSLGNVTVKLNKPIVLQGGAWRDFEAPEEPLFVLPAANGGATLESPELKVSGGLNLVTKAIQEQAEWPQALKESFKEAKKNKETALNVKIELAGGNLLYETPNAISTENLLFEAGPAFILPLKVRMINPWLEKLGGGPCTVGNEEHPVIQDLTTEGSGRALEPGGFKVNEAFTNVELAGSRLVDYNWPVAEGAETSGCGGAYESYVNAAINTVLELPNRRGSTVLQGDLFTGDLEEVRNEFEKGEEH